MTDLVLLSRAQMRRIEPFFPRSRGLPRVDDRRVISGIIDVIRHGLQWKDAPRGYGLHKTLYNRFIPGAGSAERGSARQRVAQRPPPLDTE
jgi:transposase